MKTLVVDTSTRRHWLAAYNGDSQLSCIGFEDQQSCLVELMPSIEAALREAKLKPAELDCIAVVSGPGAWSSLRIGVAAAKLLALANRVPLHALDSCMLLADHAMLSGLPDESLILTAVSAQSGKLYSALFATDGHFIRQVSPHTWSDAVAVYGTVAHLPRLTIIGDGAALLKPYTQPHWDIRPISLQDNSIYLKRIVAHIPADLAFDPAAIHDLRPLYIQPSSAEVEFKVTVS